MSFRNELNIKAAEIYGMAKQKGWHDDPRSDLEVHMLIVSEVAEATEAVRNGALHFYMDGAKPEGQAVELADAIIRILDFAGSKAWDIGGIIEKKIAYNATRPYKHGKKC
jgi:NTP pyrophosphatase (non-canonical NTP hydrolase)